MQRATSNQRWEFIQLIQEHVPTAPNGGGEFSKRTQFAKRLLRYGATLGRIAENQCNGYQTWDYKWDERAAKREELKQERIERKVMELCKLFGCEAIFQGDPRGNTLKIAMPRTCDCGYRGPCTTCPKCIKPTNDGFTNDWGREGICVPTS